MDLLDLVPPGPQERWEALRGRRPDRAPPAERESGQARQLLAPGYRLLVGRGHEDPFEDSATDPDHRGREAAGSACRKRTLADGREVVESACPNARAVDWVEQKPLVERLAARMPVWARLETVSAKRLEGAQSRAPPGGNGEVIPHWT